MVEQLLGAVLLFTTPQQQGIGPRVGHPNGLSNTMVENRGDRYWQKAQQDISYATWQPGSLLSRTKKALPAVLTRGPRSDKLVSLTFDDGPHPGFTEKLLKVLKHEKVPATFFVVGFMAEKSPGLIWEMASDGHQVANHSFSHVMLTGRPNVEMRTEYRACSDLVAHIIGRRPKYCRPPGGDCDQPVVDAGLQEGMTTVLWTDDPADYKKLPASVIKQKTLDQLCNGAIILLHDGIPQTIQILPDLIAELRKRGYRIVSLDQMIASSTSHQDM